MHIWVTFFVKGVLNHFFYYYLIVCRSMIANWFME